MARWLRLPHHLTLQTGHKQRVHRGLRVHLQQGLLQLRKCTQGRLVE